MGVYLIFLLSSNLIIKQFEKTIISLFVWSEGVVNTPLLRNVKYCFKNELFKIYLRTFWTWNG